MSKVCLKLDAIMRERGVSRYALAKRTGIGYPIIDNYYVNNPTSKDGGLWETKTASPD